MEPDAKVGSLQQRLTEALQQCRRQIEILQSAGRPLYNPDEQPQDNRAEIALLEAECHRLMQALAALNPAGS